MNESEEKMAAQGVIVGWQPLRRTGSLRVIVEFPKEFANEAWRKLGGNVDPAMSRHVVVAVITAEDSHGSA